MKSLIIVMIVSVALAYLSQYRGTGIQEIGKKLRWDPFLILMIIIMSLYVGLRTSYNDTTAYINTFNNSLPPQEFLVSGEDLGILHNPLFYAITSLFKNFTSNYHIYLLAFAFFNTTLFVRFIQKYTVNGNFPIAILLFFGLDLFVFSMAALKQVTAMAILTLAIDALIKKRYIKYYIIVIIAGLIHTYAFGYLLLPIFYTDIWNYRSFLMLGITIVIMMNFQEVISSVLEIADSAGKTIADYEVFDGNQMNFFRIVVFSVVPAMLFTFKNRLSRKLYEFEKLFGNMSIISLMFMLLASINGANMFGRIATYFLLGTVCILPTIINRLFEIRSRKLVMTLAVICYCFYFLYDNIGFQYYGINLIEFFSTLL